jgi:hypothetical protein
MVCLPFRFFLFHLFNMLFSAASLPTILLLISKPWLAAANERDRRRTCNPPMADLEVSIISTSSGSSQWGVSQDVAGTALSHALGQVPLNSSAEWRVMQIGASQPTFVFRYIFLFSPHKDSELNKSFQGHKQRHPGCGCAECSGRPVATEPFGLFFPVRRIQSTLVLG